MGLEGKRFNDGVIDLSTLRQKEQFDAQKVMETIPQQFQATNEEGEPIILETLSAIVHPRGVIFIVLTDNIEGEPPFLMIATHTDNKMNEDLRPAEEAEFMEFQEIMANYSADQETEALEEAAEDAEIIEELNQKGE